MGTLLDVEVRSEGAGTSLVLEACAKNGRRRRVYVPASTVQTVELYRNTERKSLVRKGPGELAPETAEYGGGPRR